MKAVRMVLVMAGLLAACGVDCPDGYRECTTAEGDQHCVGVITDCGMGGTICRAIECSPDAFDQCTDLFDDEHCGGCWMPCPSGTYCRPGGPTGTTAVCEPLP